MLQERHKDMPDEFKGSQSLGHTSTQASFIVKVFLPIIGKEQPKERMQEITIAQETSKRRFNRSDFTVHTKILLVAYPLFYVVVLGSHGKRTNDREVKQHVAEIKNCSFGAGLLALGQHPPGLPTSSSSTSVIRDSSFLLRPPPPGASSGSPEPQPCPVWCCSVAAHARTCPQKWWTDWGWSWARGSLRSSATRRLQRLVKV